MKTKIDHIVLVVPDLEEGILWIEKKLGVRPVYGGQHQTEGTHNALLNLGKECYLELLAIDYSNKNITANRWMGVDLIDQPTISRWAVKSDNLEEEVSFLKNVNPLLGNYKAGSRTKSDGTILKWQLSIPLPEPKVEVTPFLIDWQDSIHPTTSLDQKCELIGLNLTHPQPSEIQHLMKNLNLDFEIKKGKEAKISIAIQCPNGLIYLDL